MAIDYQLPDEIAQQYRDELKTLQPTQNTDQEDSDWWIRGAVLGGVVSGVYADQRLLDADIFPQSARHDALAQHLITYFPPGEQAAFLPGTESEGNALVTGTIGSEILQGTQLNYVPNGNAYQVTTTVFLSATAQSIPIESVSSGQDQNLLPGAPLLFPSPPAGVLANAIVDPSGISDATDPETDTEARARILFRIQNPLSVGRVSDYIQYAKAASPSVTGASVVRYPFGLGTVAVYITSGTTDIDAAIDAGIPISIIPSQALVDTVQAYVALNAPVTDCVSVFAPTPLPINVTVQVRYVSGDGSTILSGQTLTQDQLVQREVSRAIYKTPVGGFQYDNQGYVMLSNIEETIDVGLSADSVIVGVTPILFDRVVENLSATGPNLLILAEQAPIPGTITVVAF